MQFYNLKKNCLTGLRVFARIIWPLKLLSFNSILELLTILFFYYILNLLWLNNFLKHENQVCFFWNFFPRLSTFQQKSFIYKMCNAKSFNKWWSKSFEIARQLSKELFFQLWMLITFILYSQTSWNSYHMILDRWSARFYY